MKRIGFISLILLFLISLSSSVYSDQVLLDWQFEEGSGSIVFDQTGNNFNGLLSNGATWNSAIKKFGSYSIFFDGTNDLLTSMVTTETPSNLTISFWYYDTSNGNANYFLFGIGDTNETHDLQYDGTSDNLIYRYNNDSFQFKNYVIQNIVLPLNTWRHVVMSINNDANTLSYYRDNVPIIENQPIPDGISKVTSLKTLKVGTNKQSTNYFKGYIDSFQVMDFIPNSTQRTELFTSNTISLPPVSPPSGGGGGNQTPVVNGTQFFDIINTHSPINGANITTPFTLSANLNLQASCDIYIDNNYEYSVYNKLSFSTLIYDLPLGLHSYVLYCFYIDINNILNFEITNTTYFNLTKNPVQITFQVQGNDFNVDDLDLTIVTPCLNEGYSAVGTELTKYRPKYNPSGAIFRKVEDGSATFNLVPQEHEFCIINGRTIYDTNNKTANYDIQDLQGYLKVGTINVPNNVTSNYLLKIDALDIYDVHNPKAWGQTWATIIGAIILISFGFIVLMVGLSTQNGKITIAGVILLLGAFGISIPALLFAV